MKSPYQILGVKPSATADDIRAAHRRLAMKYHPDRAKGKGQRAKLNAIRMAEINAARDQLIDKDGSLKRQANIQFVAFQGDGAAQVRMGLSILDAFLTPRSASRINDALATILEEVGRDDPQTRELIKEMRGRSAGGKQKR